MGFRVAVVGATGNVGREMLKVLAERDFPADRESNPILTVDLERQEIVRPEGRMFKFEIDAFRKHCLLNGLDDIGLTLQKSSLVDNFESQRQAQLPWLFR